MSSYREGHGSDGRDGGKGVRHGSVGRGSGRGGNDDRGGSRGGNDGRRGSNYGGGGGRDGSDGRDGSRGSSDGRRGGNYGRGGGRGGNNDRGGSRGGNDGRRGGNYGDGNGVRPHNGTDDLIKLSKSLSYVLRHHAKRLGLNIQTDGYVRLDELMKLPKFEGVTIDKIQRVVKEDNKQRYSILDKTENGKTIQLIRANQGHSIEVKDLELEKITDPSQIPSVIHGTYLNRWEDIKLQGLSKMKRNHIHCASGRWGDKDVLSGMRASCNLFIYVNVSKAMNDGIEFHKSANGVILTEGVKGKLDKKYFLKVVDKDEKILYPEENS